MMKSTLALNKYLFGLSAVLLFYLQPKENLKSGLEYFNKNVPTQTNRIEGNNKTVCLSEYEDVLRKFFKYDSLQNIFVLLQDYELIYPNSPKYKYYIGLKSEHGLTTRKHILLEFHCCKILRLCSSEPKLYALDVPPSVECLCPEQRGYINNLNCLKAYLKSSLYMHIFNI